MRWLRTDQRDKLRVAVLGSTRDAAVVPLADVSQYVMTPQFSAPSQLELPRAEGVLPAAAGRVSADTASIVPPSRAGYLAEITATIRDYHLDTERAVAGIRHVQPLIDVAAAGIVSVPAPVLAGTPAEACAAPAQRGRCRASARTWSVSFRRAARTSAPGGPRTTSGSTAGIKRCRHPVVGDLTLTYEALHLAANEGLRISAYTAEPGTPSDDALKVLASWAATLNQPAETADNG